MRILELIASMDSGGAETHLCTLVGALCKDGHKIYVISSGGRMVEELERHGASHRSVSARVASPWGLLRARRILKETLKRETIEVIHAHSRVWAFLASGVARRRNIPLVVTDHARFSCGGIYRRLSRWGDRTVAVSEDLAHYLNKEYRVERRRITVIPNGVDTDLFCPSEGKPREKRIVFMSRLDRDCSMGAELLLRIFPSVLREYPDSTLWIVGGGERFSSIFVQAERLNRELCRKAVHAVGHSDRPWEILADASVFIGVSRAAIEAMSAGVPVLLCGNEGYFGAVTEENLRRASLSNFTARGQNAPTEAVLLRDLLRLLALSETERTCLGASLRAFAIARHSGALMAKQTEAIYREAREEMERRRRGALLLCGYYGYGNMGDEELLQRSLERASREYPHRKILVLTPGGRSVRGIGACGVPRFSPIAVIRAVRRSGVLAFGGGTLLQEEHGVRSLVYYWAIVRLFGMLHLPRGEGRTVLWANGIGMPRSSLGRRLTADALRHCSHIGVRDGDSALLARQMVGDSIPIVREPDLALTDPPPEGETKRLRRQLGLEGRYAVVVLRGNAGRGILKMMEYWIRGLPTEGITPVAVPMFPQEDLRATKRFCRLFQAKLFETERFSELVALAREAEVVCSMRLHGLVAARCAGTPFVGFSEDGKVQSFCRENGGVYFIDLYK